MINHTDPGFETYFALQHLKTSQIKNYFGTILKKAAMLLICECLYIASGPQMTGPPVLLASMSCDLFVMYKCHELKLSLKAAVKL